MKKSNNKNNMLRAVSVICTVVLVALIALPGCNFVGQTANVSPQNSNVMTESGTGNELCCPVCSGLDLTGPDADGYYLCNNCGARWLYDDTAIDIVNENGDIITTLDSAAGYVGGSGSSGGSGSNNGGSIKTTTRKVSSTTTTTAKTTMSFSEYMSDVYDRYKDVIQFTTDADGNLTVVNVDGKDSGLFGFKYNTTDKVFFTAEDAWQRNFGFEVTYDTVSGLGAITYDTTRVYFNYNGLDYMIQLWKGQYGFVFIGAEIGVYHRPEGTPSTSTFYECATDENKLTMSMNVYRRESSKSNDFKFLFKRSPSNTWWLTGFTPGTLQAGSYVVDEDHTKALKVDATINFKDEVMAQAFIGGLKNVTSISHNSPNRVRSFKFTEVSADSYSTSSTNGKYSLSADGTSVNLSWR